MCVYCYFIQFLFCLAKEKVKTRRVSHARGTTSYSNEVNSNFFCFFLSFFAIIILVLFMLNARQMQIVKWKETHNESTNDIMQLSCERVSAWWLVFAFLGSRFDARWSHCCERLLSSITYYEIIADGCNLVLFVSFSES